MSILHVRFRAESLAQNGEFYMHLPPKTPPFFMKDNPYVTLPVKVDAERVSQVITNFVTNAVKYTHQGYVKVGYRMEARTIDGEQREGLYAY